MKEKEKQIAQVLRSQGKSIKSISKQLNVSSGSVSLWVKDIQLSEDQIKQLKQQNPIYNRQIHGSKKRAEQARELRKQYQEEGKQKAKEGNLLHQAGCMLYWGEGAKCRTACKFVNSDLNMLLFFKQFLMESYQIPIEKIKIHVSCVTTNGISVQEIENYWQKNLLLPKECFTKTTTDILSKYSQQKKAKNKLIFGTVTLTVCSVVLIQNIYGAIQEYAGFKNDYCLF